MDINHIPENQRKLRDEVAAEYEVVGVKPGIIQLGNQKIDLTRIDLKKAEQLAALPNFPYLRKKAATPAKAK